MSRLCAVSIVLLLAASGLADDKVKPDVLTPKEIAEGWINLFDGETTFGWAIEGEATVKDGMMVLGGTRATTATCTTSLPTRLVKCQFQYAADLPKSQQPRLSVTEKAADQIPQSGREHTFATDGQITHITIVVPRGTTLRLERIVAKPAATTPLFTGKNLEGWSINKADPKRMVSKWDVTNEGELSLKNGPGDLVSEQEFANFVLQLECKTLGMWLNSGVFFRCIPGQYQNGYEAQIQNGFKGEDRTKPIDFGTGAIYRRVPSRKVVSNDNEWFTMTIVANGKRISTWVNGYQTVDWTDERPANDNPRNGYRADKGPLSLQGHDATTDILFRNLRIAEFPRANK
jgi:hypothetical protein